MVVDLTTLPEDGAPLHQLVQDLVDALENECEHTATLVRQLAALTLLPGGRERLGD